MKVRIGNTSELPIEGHAREFDCAGRPICVVRVNGVLSAMDNVCPHRGGPLSDGVVMDGKIICPWHGWQIDPVTGKPVQQPTTRVELYQLIIEGDDVFLERRPSVQ